MTKRKAISIAFVIIILLASADFRSKGIKHVLPNSELRWAREKWSDGEYLESMRWFVVANISAINTGIRWTIVEKFYIDRMNDFSNQNKFRDALDICNQASKILGGSDDEGMFSYSCLEFEEGILKQK